ncbi:hypothetical protein AC626_10395 [Pseudoalteromonas rubra]|uniref:Uncharacterized protein n=1 Tax=Pseudoalteromonas rubra TaxID=43658 RepID=A0A0L0ESU4_9GAMM|nr:hypothetical protein AC626_10395 [Pseudoalteromonas rubra]
MFDLFICASLAYAYIKKVDIEISRLGWLCIALLLLMFVSLLHAVNHYEGAAFILRYVGSVLLSYYLLKMYGIDMA